MMSLDDQELLAEFRQESLEHLADVEGQLLAIELGGANIDVDLVNTVFRAIHSIKGASGFLGLTTISELSHHLENVLNLMRNRELTPNIHLLIAWIEPQGWTVNVVNGETTSSGSVLNYSRGILTLYFKSIVPLV